MMEAVLQRLERLEKAEKLNNASTNYKGNSQQSNFQRTEGTAGNGNQFWNSNRQKQRGPATWRANRKCYNCGSPSHFYRSCPYPPLLPEPIVNDNIADVPNMCYVKGSNNAYLPLSIHGKNVLDL